jgi:hypothetical protein
MSQFEEEHDEEDEEENGTGGRRLKSAAGDIAARLSLPLKQKFPEEG